MSRARLSDDNFEMNAKGRFERVDERAIVKNGPPVQTLYDGVDGLLSMSFLARFDIVLTDKELTIVAKPAQTKTLQLDNRAEGPSSPRLALARAREFCHIGRGRLAVDAPLANRVRSGRKQP